MNTFSSFKILSGIYLFIPQSLLEGITENFISEIEVEQWIGKLHWQRIKNYCTYISHLLHQYLLFSYSKHWWSFTWPFSWAYDNLTELSNYFLDSMYDHEPHDLQCVGYITFQSISNINKNFEKNPQFFLVLKSISQLTMAKP